jgi:ADP-ribosylglycohydrolase
MAGDIIGSMYEWHSTKNIDFHLFTPFSKFTDDTVMTVANADWLLTNDSLWVIMQDYGNRFPHAGYGGMFRNWLRKRMGENARKVVETYSEEKVMAKWVNLYEETIAYKSRS